MNNMTVVRYYYVAQQGKYQQGGICFVHQVAELFQQAIAHPGFESFTITEYRPEDKV